MSVAGASLLRRAVLVGAGRMGSAMARGWVADLEAAGLSDLAIVEPAPDDMVAAAASHARITLNPQPAYAADIVVLAIKPQGFAAASATLKGFVGPETLVVSIMAGVTLASIASAFGVSRIVRAMPNTPGAIGMGVTAYALSDDCQNADAEAAERLLEPLGLVVGPLAEHQMDAVTAVSGSGPAYVFLLAEALTEAGKAAGLSADVAETLARETVTGAGALLGESTLSAADLRQAVTSPGGTTAAALSVLMGDAGLPELMRQAVAAAVARGAELAKS